MKRRYLLDTGIAQDFQERRRGVRERATGLRKQGHSVGICPPVIGELWAGLEYGDSDAPEETLARLEESIRLLTHWPYSDEAAREYGRIYAELRRKGIGIQQIDIQIAAVARTLANCVVVSKDSDLSQVSGITVENWSQA